MRGEVHTSLKLRRSDVARALLRAAPRLIGALGEVRTSLRPSEVLFLES